MQHCCTACAAALPCYTAVLPYSVLLCSSFWLVCGLLLWGPSQARFPNKQLLLLLMQSPVKWTV